MSSRHIIVVARNDETGEVQFPIGQQTLYGTGSENDILNSCRKRYGDQWSLALYAPISEWYTGSALSEKSIQSSDS